MAFQLTRYSAHAAQMVARGAREPPLEPSLCGLRSHLGSPKMSVGLTFGSSQNTLGHRHGTCTWSSLAISHHLGPTSPAVLCLHLQ